jgi:hypothetical protein
MGWRDMDGLEGHGWAGGSRVEFELTALLRQRWMW